MECPKCGNTEGFSQTNVSSPRLLNGKRMLKCRACGWRFFVEDTLQDG